MISFTVIDEQVIATLLATEVGLAGLVAKAAEELSETVAEEASGVSSRLGAPWEVSGTSPFGATVTAPEFFAHFLARGTAPHGPDGAEFLTFEVGGDQIFASFVTGIAGDPFDERAVERTQLKLEEIIVEIVKAAGG